MFLFSIKKIFLLMLCCLSVSFLDAAKSTKKLQIMINPFGPDFNFLMNAGEGIQTNPALPRPAGSYILISGLIFPGGTMKKSQLSFLVDKHGHPLSASNSLGHWQAFEKMLVTIDNSDLPPTGTRTMMSEWGLYFNEDCHNKPNNIFLLGFAQMGVPLTGEVFIEWTLGVVGGTGCNDDNHSTVSAKLYLAADATSLIKMKFSDDIKYD